MSKFAFLILHYQTLEDTISCIESITKFDTNIQDDYIVIVDNGSKNGSGDTLIEKYKNFKNIFVIKSDENLGFAKGNNLGFKFIKENLRVSFIVMMNNDTELIDINFKDNIEKLYNEEKFAVLGPKIILKDGYINPVVKSAGHIKEIKREIFKTKIKLLFNYFHLEELILDRLKKGYNEMEQKNNRCNPNEKAYNVMLHGCLLIFSTTYIDKFDGLYDGTFLYCEEEFLYYRLKSNNLLSIYDPNICILHKEYSSTKSINKSNNSYRRFRYKNILKSEKLLLDYLQNQYTE